MVSGADTSCWKQLCCPRAVALAEAGGDATSWHPKIHRDALVGLGRASGTSLPVGKGSGGIWEDPEPPARMWLGGWALWKCHVPGLGCHAVLVHHQGHHSDFRGVWKCFDRQWGAEGGESPPRVRSGGRQPQCWHPPWHGPALPFLGQGCWEAESQEDGCGGEGAGLSQLLQPGHLGALPWHLSIAQGDPAPSGLSLVQAQLSMPQFPWQEGLCPLLPTVPIPGVSLQCSPGKREGDGSGAVRSLAPWASLLPELGHPAWAAPQGGLCAHVWGTGGVQVCEGTHGCPAPMSPATSGSHPVLSRG